ncbi:MAG: Gfo/Idh/MocA family oxidoreductase [Ruminococcaceae bacterium]|nr:Gfo/Idh/MocA family oxidoreductase [Oscillospiraceae bacterium]
MKKLRVAIIGQGRSGRNIHGRFFQSEDNDFCQVVCVVEADEFRRARAAEEFGCDTAADHTELYGRDDIDLVVNATYSQLHYSITKDLLEHGFNVLVEKPFARTYFECLDLINTAKRNNVIVSVFHQTLLTPSHLNVKEIIESGKLGDIYQINLKYSSFGRRWDWQTLQSKCAGSVYNSGPHPIGQALDFIGWDKTAHVAFSSLSRVLTFGDSDDFAKVIISAEGKPTIDIEIISADAFAGDFNFKVFGSKGTLISTHTNYSLKYIKDFSVYPEREVIPGFMSDENGYPAACSEQLEFTEESGTIDGSAFDIAVRDFYKMLSDAILLGKEPAVTPEMAADVIRIIEACHAENPLSVEFE